MQQTLIYQDLATQLHIGLNAHGRILHIHIQEAQSLTPIELQNEGQKSFLQLIDYWRAYQKRYILNFMAYADQERFLQNLKSVKNGTASRQGHAHFFANKNDLFEGPYVLQRKADGYVLKIDMHLDALQIKKQKEVKSERISDLNPFEQRLEALLAAQAAQISVKNAKSKSKKEAKKTEHTAEAKPVEIPEKPEATARQPETPERQPESDESSHDSVTQDEQYFSLVAHEMRTPLNAVIGYADLLRHEPYGPVGHDKYAEFIELIHQSGQHVLTLVDDLLDLRQMQSFEPSFQAVDLNEIVTQAVDMLGPKDVPIYVQMPHISLQADAKLLLQYLLNMLSNAAKFTQAGQIDISYEQREGQHHIIIKDTGIGMDAAKLDKLGQFFTDAHRVGLKGEQGSGLGLYIAQKIASLHHGQLKIASAENHGTVTTLIFPLDVNDITGAPIEKNILTESLEEQGLEQDTAAQHPIHAQHQAIAQHFGDPAPDQQSAAEDDDLSTDAETRPASKHRNFKKHLQKVDYDPEIWQFETEYIELEEMMCARIALLDEDIEIDDNKGDKVA